MGAAHLESFDVVTSNNCFTAVFGMVRWRQAAATVWACAAMGMCGHGHAASVAMHVAMQLTPFHRVTL